MSDQPLEPMVPQCAPYIVEETPGKHWFCACGRSQRQPYCDGAHKGTGITPIEVDVPAPTKIAYCGCKHSGNLPYCDGSHRNLTPRG